MVNFVVVDEIEVEAGVGSEVEMDVSPIVFLRWVLVM